MISKLTYFIFMVMLSMPCYAANIVAIVNDKPISQWDVENTAKLLKFQQGEKYANASATKLKKDALENLIDTALKKQKAVSLNIKMPAEEVDNAIAHLEMQNQMQRGSFLKLLKERKIPEKVLRNQIEADLMWLSYLRAQPQAINISSASIEKKNKLIKKDLEKQGITDGSILLWELAQGVLPEDVNPNTTLESKSCNAFLDHIAIGPYPDSAKKGWVNPHDLPQELYTLLADIAVGETLGPLKTPEGMLLFMKCDVKSQRVMPTSAEIKEQMEMEQMEMLSNRLLEMERRQAAIEYK